MQTALTFEAKKLKLIEAIMAIEDEALLDKLRAYLTKITRETANTQ